MDTVASGRFVHILRNNMTRGAIVYLDWGDTFCYIDHHCVKFYGYPIRGEGWGPGAAEK